MDEVRRENSRRSLQSFLWKSSPRNPTSTSSTRSAASSASSAIPKPPIWPTSDMYALQHRGQESAGIVSSNGKALISHRGMGLVADIFNSDVINRLEGTAAIGHNRYSTTGSTSLKNCQPLVVEYARGGLAVAHNGNLVNFAELRERLEPTARSFSHPRTAKSLFIWWRAPARRRWPTAWPKRWRRSAAPIRWCS